MNSGRVAEYDMNVMNNFGYPFLLLKNMNQNLFTVV